ncbi:MAG: hypothetical protein RL514_754 [Verrucomicrobiota bacterium]|jgi:methyl-accepting chemotaxis protein
MKNPLNRLSIPTKLTLISVTFAVPIITLVTLLVMVSNEAINIAQLELQGNKFQRPLTELMDLVPRHGLLIQRVAGGESNQAAAAVQLQAQVDRAFEGLVVAEGEVGGALKFTTEELTKRKREHARAATLQRKWQELKAQTKPSALDSAKGHDALVTDLRTMVAHMGDTSNLILDPELDTYYLMDVTLIRLPATQVRLAEALRFGTEALQRRTMTAEECAQFIVYAAQLKEQDLDGVRTSVQTALIEDINFHGKSPTFNDGIKQPLADYTTTLSNFLELLNVAASGINVPDREKFIAAGQATRDASYRLWGTAVGELDAMLRMRIARVETRRNVQLGITSIVVLLALQLVYRITINITRPLKQADRMVEAVAARDLTVRVELVSSDEIGRICQALNTMAEQLRASIQSIGENAQSVASSSHELSAVSAEVSANSEETAAQGRVVAEAATQVSRNIQTVAIASEEMNASISEIARNASQASRVATQAVGVADRTNATMTKLGVSSAEIGNVLKVISNIADQTNLLALNATIEAARAGELGKGFAVVANEVKELARQTAKATDEITFKIGNMQTDAQGAMQAIREISTIIKEINDIQTVIAGAVEEQAATTNEISNNTQQAARASTEIARNITSVADAAKGTTAGATQTAAAAAQLARLASDLRRVVDQFKLADTAKESGARPNGTRI